jgi:hypothetical protein
VRPPLIVGIALAVLILAAGLVAPVFRSSQRKASWQAQERAELARRELARVSPELDWLKDGVNTAALKADKAALDAAVAQAGEQFGKRSAEWRKWISAAQELAQRRRLPAPALQPPSANAAGIQQSFAAFDKAVQENNALLKAAIDDAQAAVGIDGSAIAVQHSLGMAEYLRAAELLVEAERQRTRQADAQTRLLDDAAEWKLARSAADHFRGLEVSGILSKLRVDLDELSDRRDQANKDLAASAAAVKQREQDLTQADDEMKATAQELQQLETQGFAAGDDQAFASYRTRYLALSGRLQQAQEREQELRFGGRPGATLVGEDPNTFAIEGGEPLPGLGELRQRLAVTQQAAQRYSTANASLEQQINHVRDLGKQAESEAARHETRVTELDTQQKSDLAEVAAAAAAALTKETDALKAAETSARAFRQGQAVAQNWLRAARDIQQNADPNRRNERLNLLLKDQYLEQVSQSAEAAARVLAGRIHAQRVESNQRLIDEIRLFAEINPNPEFKFDSAPFQTELDTAREEGLKTLKEARDTYEKLSKGPPNTAWVPLGALAAAQLLTARLDASQADTFREQAAATITKAVEKRERSPYLEAYVKLRDHLVAAKPATTKGEEEELFPGDESKAGQQPKPEGKPEPGEKKP